MKNITIKKLYEICQDNKYIALRFGDNYLMGVNCSVAKILNPSKDIKEIGNKETQFYSFRPISFMEYIRIKRPFHN